MTRKNKKCVTNIMDLHNSGEAHDPEGCPLCVLGKAIVDQAATHTCRFCASGEEIIRLRLTLPSQKHGIGHFVHGKFVSCGAADLRASLTIVLEQPLGLNIGGATL